MKSADQGPRTKRAQDKLQQAAGLPTEEGEKEAAMEEEASAQQAEHPADGTPLRREEQREEQHGAQEQGDGHEDDAMPGGERTTPASDLHERLEAPRTPLGTGARFYDDDGTTRPASWPGTIKLISRVAAQKVDEEEEEPSA